MKLEYLIIGFFAIAILYVLLLYIINAIKRNKKNKPKDDAKAKQEGKPDEKSGKADGGKVEVKHEVLNEAPLNRAIKDANIQYEINEAFEKINAEKDEYEKTSQKTVRSSRLQLDRSDFDTELRASRLPRKNRNTLKSETAQIGHEGPSHKAQSSIDTSKQDIETLDPTSQTLADEINNMSPEAKAILINDILNNKY